MAYYSLQATSSRYGWCHPRTILREDFVAELNKSEIQHHHLLSVVAFKLMPWWELIETDEQMPWVLKRWLLLIRGATVHLAEIRARLHNMLNESIRIQKTSTPNLHLLLRA